jgi:proline dehydrogenase
MNMSSTPTPTHTANQQQEGRPKFNDPESAHGNKSLIEVLRSILVFKLCQLPFLVQNADQLLNYSNKILGSTITDAIIRHTFFKQFCAGENENDIQPILDKLKLSGIGAILDYAAEEDAIESKSKSTSTSSLDSHDIVAHPPFNQPARVYEYQSEQKCDHHVDIFLKCIHAVRQSYSKSNDNPDKASTSASASASATSPGFAAIKVTALGNPLLLERMSIAINEANNLFAKFDKDMDGIMTRNEFKSAYTLFFNDANQKLPNLLDELDPNHSNQIDYITFMSKLLTPFDLPRICATCKAIGPLSLATPSTEEIDLMYIMHERAHTLAKEASECGVRLLIDAEHTQYQPAIDNLALELMTEYNDKSKTDIPIIFNTYQCYLKDAMKRVEIDLERSIRHNYHFGTKLVRGAYMVSERARAKQMNISSPIHSTIQETHDCYNDIVEMLLRNKVENSSLESIEIMCATHNQESIEKALDLLNELKLDDVSMINGSSHAAAIHFAQLYGMSDNLTFPLGQHKYPAYKYVPYGEIHEVMPYLLRRAQENSDILGNAAKEMSLLFGSLKSRFHFMR